LLDQLKSIGFVENDYWIFNLETFQEFVSHATNGGNRTMVDALLDSGSVNPILIWNIFLYIKQIECRPG